MVDGLERIIEFILIGTLDKVDQEENDVMKNGRIRLRAVSMLRGQVFEQQRDFRGELRPDL
jgi:hypothetical protein